MLEISVSHNLAHPPSVYIIRGVVTIIDAMLCEQGKHLVLCYFEYFRNSLWCATSFERTAIRV